MPSNGEPHLSDEQLARCRDGELARDEAAHLEDCAVCGQRLRDLTAAAAAYAEYRDSIRAPSLPPAPQAWQSLGELISQHETGGEGLSSGSAVPQPAASPPKKLQWLWAPPLAAGWAFRWLWVPALAAACTLIWTQVITPRRQEQTEARANELLNRSARLELMPARMITLRTHGRTIVRPAVLDTDSASVADPDMAHLQSLFRRARYSWREPLAPRSFQAWRRGVKNRKDSVTEIGESGSRQFYRVRTEDPEGLLRSASLTLRSGDLRLTNADFEFRGEGPLAMEEGTSPVEASRRPRPPAAKEAALETKAGPEDTLHVLAALDEIGADAGEPIEVTLDAGHRHVVVRAGGVSEERRRQIAKALDSLPRVTVDLASAAREALPLTGHEKRSPVPPANENSIPAPLRQRLEAGLGGAVAVQEATDRSLDASASALARVHALEVLAQNFPPDTEARLSASDRLVLGGLRQRHVSELEKSLSQIRTSLRPLLEPGGAVRPPDLEDGVWQSGIPSLAAAARDTDRLLNRLLAGSYSESSGEEMLRDLAPSLQRLEGSIQSQGKRQ